MHGMHSWNHIEMSTKWVYYWPQFEYPINIIITCCYFYLKWFNFHVHLIVKIKIFTVHQEIEFDTLL